MPMDRMLIESESPFMIPAEYRGKRNKPVSLHATAEYIAELREMDPEETANQLFENAQRVFQIA